MSAAGGRPPAATREHIEVWSEDYIGKDGTSKTRQQSKCKYCGIKAVLSSMGRWSNHLTGVATFCSAHGGLGPCSKVPEEVARGFR